MNYYDDHPSRHRHHHHHCLSYRDYHDLLSHQSVVTHTHTRTHTHTHTHTATNKQRSETRVFGDEILTRKRLVITARQSLDQLPKLHLHRCLNTPLKNERTVLTLQLTHKYTHNPVESSEHFMLNYDGSR